MNSFHFSSTPQQRHRVHRQPGSDRVIVDGQAVAVQPDGQGRYTALVDGRHVAATIGSPVFYDPEGKHHHD